MNLMGIIFANIYDSSLGELTNKRTMASLPYGGRYLVLSFIPPSQIAVGSNTVWFSVLIIGAIVFVVIPYIIYGMRKPSWKAPDANIEKFEWEKQ